MSAIDFAAFVNELARVSGEAILPFFRTSIGVNNKNPSGAFDPVTAADHAAEQTMRTLIRGSFPDHGIVGEEFGDERADAEYVWTLDPIDGTKAFIGGLPIWGTLIGLSKRGAPIYGMMHQPFIGERFVGDGAGANYHGPNGDRVLKSRACAKLQDAVLYTTSPQLMSKAEHARFARVEKRALLSRYGGDCYSYCMVAAGHIDLVIEAALKPYDIVPLIPIIQGAGGIVSDWAGKPAVSGGQVIAAGDHRLHAKALEMLNS
jgi:myo-inositol-1(or 4)-monophosphatase